MSLGVVIKGAEGVVLAADSRVTLQAARPNQPPIVVTFDNATKLLSFGASGRHLPAAAGAEERHKWVGAVTYGTAVIGARTAHSFIPEFELSLPGERLPIAEYARRLSEFYMARWQEVMPSDYQGGPMTFLIGGYDEGAAYGSVYVLDIPTNPTPQPRNPGEHDFGMTWGGQLELASRIVHGFEPTLPEAIRQALNLNPEQVTQLMNVLRNFEFRFPYQVLPLQDCVDLATFIIRTTITAQTLAVGIRGVGGPIDVATITRVSGLDFVQRKKIRGEQTEGAF